MLFRSDIDAYARQKGIPDIEVVKLKSRIQQLDLEKELDQKIGQKNFEDEGQFGKRKVDEPKNAISSDSNQNNDSQANGGKSKIFGAELFTNKNLTFEPNLRMATPPNYKLAADDEVLIDVYGYSEVQHKLKVTPDGYIRIPNVGPVYVNGLTIEEAKNRITKQLSNIYSGIKSGNTFVQITLGSIRSIRVLLIGEVVRPGSYTIPSLSFVEKGL